MNRTAIARGAQVLAARARLSRTARGLGRDTPMIRALAAGRHIPGTADDHEVTQPDTVDAEA